MAALTALKRPANRARWERAAKDQAYVPLLPLIITETPAELMLKVLQSGTVSTNIYLRRLHNFCVDMNWLPWPLVPKRQWPVVRFKEKRAITADEHRQIVERERNPERKAFYQLSWHLGASQSDLAHLQAEDVDWNAGIICFVRMKTRWRGVHRPRFGLAKQWPRFWRNAPRQDHFSRICKTLSRDIALRISHTLGPWIFTSRQSPSAGFHFSRTVASFKIAESCSCSRVCSLHSLLAW